MEGFKKKCNLKKLHLIWPKLGILAILINEFETKMKILTEQEKISDLLIWRGFVPFGTVTEPNNFSHELSLTTMLQ